MHILPEALVDAIRARIADPARRHYRQPGASLGAFSSGGDVAKLMDESPIGNGDIFRSMLDKMAEWGHPNPTFHVVRGEHGEISASTEDRDAYPLADAAPAAELAALEATIGRPLPGDLKQMWGIANGGWGPGFSFTTGHGPGLHSAEGVKNELEDLRRRGPGYTAEMAWPENLLPLTEGEGGMVSYDLDTGQIVAFDDHWYDHDIALIEDAFGVTHLSLGEWLEEWVSG